MSTQQHSRHLLVTARLVADIINEQRTHTHKTITTSETTKWAGKKAVFIVVSVAYIHVLMYHSIRMWKRAHNTTCARHRRRQLLANHTSHNAFGTSYFCSSYSCFFYFYSCCFLFFYVFVFFISSGSLNRTPIVFYYIRNIVPEFQVDVYLATWCLRPVPFRLHNPIHKICKADSHNAAHTSKRSFGGRSSKRARARTSLSKYIFNDTIVHIK